MSVNTRRFHRVAETITRTAQILGSGLRVFVWGGLRDGAIDLRPLSHTLRTLTVVGFALTLAFLIGIVLGEPLRQLGSRVNLNYPITSTRFAQSPAWLVPVTLAAIAIGWSYVLTGALRSHPLARWGTFLIFFFAAIDVSSDGLLVLADDKGILILVVAGCILGLAACFIVLPRVAQPLATDFVIVTSLTAAIFALTFRGAVMTEQATGLPNTGPLITSLIGYSFLITVPLLIFAGVEMVSFAMEASRWVVETVERFTAAWVTVCLLILVLGLRLWQILPERAALGLAGQDWGAIAGAVLFCAGLALIGRRSRWRPAGEPLPLVAIFVVIVLLIFSLRFAIAVVPTIYATALFATRETMGAAEDVSRLNAMITAINAAEVEHRALITAAAGLVLAWFARRRSPALATFGLILAWHEGLFWLTSAGRPLAALSAP